MRNTVPITMIGNLTDVPELRITDSGVPVARFTVAVNPRHYDKATGEWKDRDPSFFNVTAWRDLGENAAESLRKGDRVVVTGTLAQRRWKDAKTDEPRSAWDVTADAVGADLTYARVTIKKMARGNRGEVPPDDPWATASPAPPPAANEEPPF